MSGERALIFGQWKTFFKNCNPVRVRLRLAYKINENDCSLRFFVEFIKTQKRYPTSFDKISIISWKLLAISSQNFSCKLKSSRTYSLWHESYLSLQLLSESLVSNGENILDKIFYNQDMCSLRIRINVQMGYWWP